MPAIEEGHLLGRYRVEAFLAEGGMGRVYRAVDTVLGRRVALKVLASAGRPDSPAVARLLREARAAAALSHPNICSVFDVGEIEGQPFIAMELVQGTSLRHLIADPATGLDQRLRWVHDLACALAAAHQAHIVHRDIKPDNVMVASDGRVRLLDFGVAKWGDGARDASGAPIAAGAFRTQDGQVVGTTGYMAPEQAEGGHVDGRTDQFAWGVVAYETLSARHPFGHPGSFAEPPLLSGIVPALPFGVAAVIAKALALEPSQRFADMDEIVAALQPLVGAAPPLPPARAGVDAPGGDASERTEAAAAVASTAPGAQTTRSLHAARPPERRVRIAVLALVGAVVLGGAVAGAVLGGRHWGRARHAVSPAGPQPPPSIALRASNIRRITFGDGCEEFPSFLPDGRSVIYDGDDGTGNYVLYRLDLAEGATPRVLVPQDDPGWDMAPSISPAGDRVVFVHRGKQHSGAMIAPLDGSAPPRALGVPTTHPRWSFDGRGLWAGRDGVAGLYDVSTGALIRTLALPPGTRAVWVLDGSDGTVVAQLSTGSVEGPTRLVLFATGGSIRWQAREELAPGLAWAPDGRHVIASRFAIAGQIELVAIPVDGAPIVSLAATGIAPRDGLDVSRDGSKIAWSTCRQTSRVSAIGAASGAATPLAREEADAIALARIPGRRELAVVSARTGRPRLYIMDPTGERPPREVEIGDHGPRDLAVSPDGARFAVSVAGAGIGVGALFGDAGFRMLTDHAGDASPWFRRAGDTVVFTRPRGDGTTQVMVAPVAGGPAVALLGPGTRGAAISPVDDAIVFLTGQASSPQLADARGGGVRPLSAALTGLDYGGLRFSPDGARVLLLRANQELIEIDVASGAIVRSVAAARGEAFYSPFYGPEGPAVVRVRWQGSIYVADTEFRSLPATR